MKVLITNTNYVNRGVNMAIGPNPRIDKRIKKYQNKKKCKKCGRIYTENGLCEYCKEGYDCYYIDKGGFVLEYDKKRKDQFSRRLYKFKHNESHKDFILELVLKVLNKYYQDFYDAEVVIPVPPRKGEENPNIAPHHIGKSIANEINSMFKEDVVYFSEKMEPLKEKDLFERKKAIKGKLSLNKEMENEVYLVVDDIFTTGSTLNEIAKILKNGGAQTVNVFCAGRSIYRKSEDEEDV